MTPTGTDQRARPLVRRLRRIAGLPSGDAPGEAGARVSHLHRVEQEAAGLDQDETRQLRSVRRFGACGTVLMAVGALGAGAQPVLQNPVYGHRVIGLLSRMPTVALTVAMTGTAMLVIAWLLLGRLAVGRLREGNTPRRLSRSQMDRTMLLWMLPLLVAPPMFSKDVYSYLAQSEITARGLDPYSLGPAQALGVDNVLTRSVPTIWRDTPAPYEPLFLWLGKVIGAVSGDNVVAGVLLHRLLEVGGVCLIIWALPRLAKRCGIAPVTSLWLGAANPLVFLHLIAGIHNEALMIGLMVAGLEICLRAVYDTDPFGMRGWLLLLAGAGVIVASSAIKIPSIMALGFVGVAFARRRGPGLRNVVWVAVLLGAIAVAGQALFAWATDLGFGWVATLGTASEVRSWMSITTLLGMGTGGTGMLLGLGNHTTAVLAIMKPIAFVLVALGVLRMLIATHSGRIHPVGGLGVSLAILVILFPVVHPWYLLWALVPLAAWATTPAFRVPAVAVSAIVCLVGPTPNGGEYPPFVIVEAALAALLTIVVIRQATRRRIEWTRRQPGRTAAPPATYAGKP
ncbi:polyprenol phosphomannose-dependent alpha 1,6 mannosyltransferase MptB [Tomitella gaofuii]|uniref:polyprenol phosphomannose-dependent alpha 1,6 mannosyltransferase MptB n=1 Tax=Tomitella gaofuii TaxID=2760083 RepID=UPI0015FE12CB